MTGLRHPGSARRALLWLAAAAAYPAVSAVGDRLGYVVDGVPFLAPAAGVAFTAVQLGGPWWATAVFVGAFAEGLLDGLHPAAALVLALGAAAIGLASLAVTRALDLRPRGERFHDTLIRTAAAGVGAVVGASGTLAALAVAGRLHDGAELWGVLLLANVAGILVVSPFARAWIQRESRGVARGWELVALLLAPGALATSVLTGLVGSAGPVAYLVFPIVVWAALRTGRMGVSAILLTISLMATETAANGRGPFHSGSAKLTAAQLDSFIIVLALTGLLLAGLDLERRVTASGLSEAEERHRRLVAQLPLVTYERPLVAGAAPAVVSPQTAELLGYPVEAWTSEPHFAASIVHPDDRARHAALNARSLVEDDVTAEYRMIAADGRVVWLLDRMIVVRDESGRAVRQQGYVVDITERRELEEQLARAQRIEALGLLAGGVAHDFNNLLTAISGYTQLALDRLRAGDELVRSNLQEVQKAAASAADLTRRLLAFGRRQVLQRTVLDLNEVVREAEQLLARVIGEDVRIVTDLAPELPYIEGDRAQLVQVLMNLAVNGRDAMPGGGALTIATELQGAEVVLRVADTGAGIPEAARARIFEPFFTTKDVGDGTGLGLAMVYGIVEQSGGRIDVDSASGRGTTFSIWLPVTDAQPAPDAPVRRAGRDGGSETVLLVEDEEVVRRLIAEMLEREGYRVVVAASPDDALAVREPWDLLLTDVVMPGMSGPDLAERLIGAQPGAGVLFTSGYSGDEAAARHALSAELLQKPFTLEELARKVRAALDARVAR